MEVWASYSLSDLLLFSPDAYFRLYELHNAALWPLHLVVIAVALVLLALTGGKESRSGKFIALLLGLLWGAVAWWFLYKRYAQINLAASWFSIAFAVQALLLFAAGIAGNLGLDRAGWHLAPASRPGLILFLYALLLHPIYGLLTGRSWTSAEFFGIAPDATALGTLGILLMGSGVLSRYLAIIPLLWCLISGLTYLAMEMPSGLMTPTVAVLAIVASRHLVSVGKGTDLC